MFWEGIMLYENNTEYIGAISNWTAVETFGELDIAVDPCFTIVHFNDCWGG